MLIVELIETITIKAAFALSLSEDITEVCKQLKEDNMSLGILQGVEVYLNAVLAEGRLET